MEKDINSVSQYGYIPLTRSTEFLVAFCVTLIGYVSTHPQPGDASSPQLFWMTMFVWLGLPVIGWICNYIAMAFYPLSREKMVEVQEKNAAFRAEQKVQSESAAK